LLLTDALHAGARGRRLQQACQGADGTIVVVSNGPLSVRAAADRYGALPAALLAANPSLNANSQISDGTQLCIPLDGEPAMFHAMLALAP
jgi:hypothetical protein